MKATRKQTLSFVFKLKDVLPICMNEKLFSLKCMPTEVSYIQELVMCLPKEAASSTKNSFWFLCTHYLCSCGHIY